MIENEIEMIDRLLNESLFSNRGMLIAQEIAMISGVNSPQEFLEFISKKENENIIVAGIYRGMAADRHSDQLLRRIETISSLAANNRASFPLYSRMLATSIKLAEVDVRVLLGLDIIIEVLLGSDNPLKDDESFREAIMKSSNVKIVESQLSDYLCTIIAEGLEQIAQKRFDLMEGVIKIIASHIVNSPERQLHSAIKSRRQIEQRFLKHETDSWEGDIGVLLNLLRPRMGRTEYNELSSTLSDYLELMEE